MKISQTPTCVPIGPALVSPGEILDEEFLKPMGLSQSALAERMGVTRMRISEIIRDKRAITAETAETAETAILLGKAFGTSARLNY